MTVRYATNISASLTVYGHTIDVYFETNEISFCRSRTLQHLPTHARLNTEQDVCPRAVNTTHSAAAWSCRISQLLQLSLMNR